MAEKEYIEREALVKRLKKEECDCECLWAILDIPTVDVAPVRHGEWASEETAVTCTACGRSYDTDFEVKQNVIRDFDYCPNCGAKMDGKDGDTNAKL